MLRGDLMGLVQARVLSKATMHNTRQNLTFAFFNNAAGVPIAGRCVVSAVRLAAVANAWRGCRGALSPVRVIANALRLSRRRSIAAGAGTVHS